MTWQVFAGCMSGLVGLLLLYVGYCMVYVGNMLVAGPGEEAGMPKWKAAIVAAIVAAVLGLIASQGSDRIGSFYLLDEPERSDFDSTTTNARPPAESFSRVFVFCCGAMWVGIARSDKR